MEPAISLKAIYKMKVKTEIWAHTALLREGPLGDGKAGMSIKSSWLHKRERLKLRRERLRIKLLGHPRKERSRQQQGETVVEWYERLRDLPTSTSVLLCFLCVSALAAVAGVTFILHDVVEALSRLAKWQLIARSVYGGQEVLSLSRLYSCSCLLLRLLRGVSE